VSRFAIISSLTDNHRSHSLPRQAICLSYNMALSFRQYRFFVKFDLAWTLRPKHYGAMIFTGQDWHSWSTVQPAFSFRPPKIDELTHLVIQADRC
jgi:hypothetical protein